MPTPLVLVVGGAGYIGSHMVKPLTQSTYNTATLDNLSTGYRDAVLGGEFIHADLADRPALDRIFAERSIDAVMHFASFIQVGKSVKETAKYYENNVTNTLTGARRTLKSLAAITTHQMAPAFAITCMSPICAMRIA